MTVRYIGVVSIAEAMAVSRHAVHKWRSRYPADSTHPFPSPDVDIDGAPGWRPGRLTEVTLWRDGLPGRGTRQTAARQEYLRASLRHGLDRDEAMRALATFTEEFPEMTEPEVCAWLIGKWSS